MPPHQDQIEQKSNSVQLQHIAEPKVPRSRLIQFIRIDGDHRLVGELASTLFISHLAAIGNHGSFVDFAGGAKSTCDSEEVEERSSGFVGSVLSHGDGGDHYQGMRIAAAATENVDGGDRRWATAWTYDGRVSVGRGCGSVAV